MACLIFLRDERKVNQANKLQFFVVAVEFGGCLYRILPTAITTATATTTTFKFKSSIEDDAIFNANVYLCLCSWKKEAKVWIINKKNTRIIVSVCVCLLRLFQITSLSIHSFV